MKGAPEIILTKCTHHLHNRQEKEIDEVSVVLHSAGVTDAYLAPEATIKPVKSTTSAASAARTLLTRQLALSSAACMRQVCIYKLLTLSAAVVYAKCV